MDNKNRIFNLKEEVSKDLGVDTREHVYMGDLPSNYVGKIFNCGKVGGEMVKRMIEEQEKKLK